MSCLNDFKKLHVPINQRVMCIYSFDRCFVIKSQRRLNNHSSTTATKTLYLYPPHDGSRNTWQCHFSPLSLLHHNSVVSVWSLLSYYVFYFIVKLGVDVISKNKKMENPQVFLVSWINGIFGQTVCVCVCLDRQGKDQGSTTDNHQPWLELWEDGNRRSGQGVLRHFPSSLCFPGLPSWHCGADGWETPSLIPLWFYIFSRGQTSVWTIINHARSIAVLLLASRPFVQQPD